MESICSLCVEILPSGATSFLLEKILSKKGFGVQEQDVPNIISIVNNDGKSSRLIQFLKVF